MAGMINIAKRSCAPDILTIDIGNRKNNGIISKGRTLLLIFLNVNIPMITRGKIIGKRK